MVPEFSKMVSPEFFRYGFCGAANMVFDWIVPIAILLILLNGFGVFG